MSRNMTTPPIYAIHWHQKQRNHHLSDKLLSHFDGHLEAAFELLFIAEAHGVTRAEHGCFSEDDCYVLRDLDVGPFVLTLLRSNEWPIDGEEPTDEPESDGEVAFRLVNPLATNVEERSVELVQLRYCDDPADDE